MQLLHNPFRIAALLAVLSYTLSACNSTPATATQEGATGTPAATDPSALPTPDTTHTKAVSAVRDTLLDVSQRHYFSNPGKADLFRLVFRGPSVLKGTGEFTITDAGGQVIFREILSEPDLEAALVYEMKTPTATPAEREAFVRRRINQFFQPAQFHSPAVERKATFPAGIENLDQATWEDIRQRPDAVRFEYLKGKEDRRQIVWSPLKKQTVRLQ
jgi:hypothetical protein